MHLSTLARHASTLIDVYYTQTNPHNFNFAHTPLKLQNLYFEVTKSDFKTQVL